MLSLIKATCWAFYLKCVLRVLSLALCLHIYVRICWRGLCSNFLREGRTFGPCDWQNWIWCSHCKLKQDVHTGSSQLKIISYMIYYCPFLILILILFLSAHNSRYIEFRVVGDSCSLVSPFFCFWTVSNMISVTLFPRTFHKILSQFILCLTVLI